MKRGARPATRYRVGIDSKGRTRWIAAVTAHDTGQAKRLAQDKRPDLDLFTERRVIVVAERYLVSR